MITIQSLGTRWCFSTPLVTALIPIRDAIPLNNHEPPRPKRFHGTVTLDPTRVGRDASRIADEVISYLSGLVG